MLMCYVSRLPYQASTVCAQCTHLPAARVSVLWSGCRRALPFPQVWFCRRGGGGPAGAPAVLLPRPPQQQRGGHGAPSTLRTSSTTLRSTAAAVAGVSEVAAPPEGDLTGAVSRASQQQ